MDNAHPLLNKQTIDNDQGLTKEQTSIPAWLPYVIASIMFFGGLGVAAIGLSGYLGALQMTDLEAIIVMGSGGGAALIGIVIAGVNFYVHRVKKAASEDEDQVQAPKAAPSNTIEPYKTVFGTKEWEALGVTVADNVMPEQPFVAGDNQQFMMIYLPEWVVINGIKQRFNLKALEAEGIFPQAFFKNIDPLFKAENTDKPRWIRIQSQIDPEYTNKTHSQQQEKLETVGYEMPNVLEVAIMVLMCKKFRDSQPVEVGMHVRCADKLDDDKYLDFACNFDDTFSLHFENGSGTSEKIGTVGVKRFN